MTELGLHPPRLVNAREPVIYPQLQQANLGRPSLRGIYFQRKASGVYPTRPDTVLAFGIDNSVQGPGALLECRASSMGLASGESWTVNAAMV